MKIYLGRIHPEPLMSKIVQDDIEAVTSLLEEKENDFLEYYIRKTFKDN